MSGAHMCITDLPAKTTETCVLYVDGAGKLSTGIASTGGTGSTGGGIGWSNLTNSSTVAGCGTIASGGTICQNTIYGVCAGAGLTTGCGNTAIGFTALRINTIGNDNIANGSSALYSNVSGSTNIAVGCQAMYYNTGGTGNVAIGGEVLQCNIIGNYNVSIGRRAGYSETGSSKLHIANCEICTLVCGDFANKCVKIDGKLSVIQDIELTAISCGIILRSPDGCRWCITVPNGGASLTILAI